MLAIYQPTLDAQSKGCSSHVMKARASPGSWMHTHHSLSAVCCIGYGSRWIGVQMYSLSMQALL